MNMNRLNRMLAAILIVQLIIAVLVLWPRSSATTAAGPLLPGLAAADVVKLTVQDAGGDSIELARRTGRWVLPAAGDYPAQDDTIDDLLAKIAGLQTDRLVTQTANSHKRLQVATDDFVRRIGLETAAGQGYTLYLGSSPQARATHVRLEGQNEVYLSDLASFDVGAQVTSYVDTTYFSLPAADVVAITLQNANGELAFTKDAAGEWTLAGLAEGEALDTVAVTSLVDRATTVRLTRPLGAEAKADYGLDEPSAVVTLLTRSGGEEGGEAEQQTYTLEVGAQDPADNSYAVHVSSSPYYVRVAQFSVDDLVAQGRDDFLAEPTPTPEGEPAPAATPES